MDEEKKSIVIEWLQSQKADSIYAGLCRLLDSDIEIFDEDIINLISRLLTGDDVEILYLSVQALKRAALKGIDITHALPSLQQLFDDARLPKHLLNMKAKIGDSSIGGEAINTVALHYFHQKKIDELKTFVVRPGQQGRLAVRAMTSAKTADEVEPFLSVLQRILEADNDDGSINKYCSKKGFAAMVLTNYYWLKKEWGKIEAFISHENESVRLGTISEIDNIAEKNKHDIDPILPALIAVFDKAVPEFGETRIAVARGLVSLMSGNEMKSKTFICSGVDLMKIPEIISEIEDMNKFIKKFKNDR